MLLCVAGRSKDVVDHSGETPKPKTHNNQGEKGQISCQNCSVLPKLTIFCYVYDKYQILIWTTSTVSRR